MISIIIPAYNESNVIQRCIREIYNGLSETEMEIIVVCNGCTDDTAEKARSMGSAVRVFETPIGNKIHALNIADKEARGYPRFYLDADIILTGASIKEMSTILNNSEFLAIAPLPTFDTHKCSWFVKSYYIIHQLLPAFHEGVGGSGVYGLSETGRKRFLEFPEITADDLFVRLQFSTNERLTIKSYRSLVYTPRSLKELVAIKTRSCYGILELKQIYPYLWQNIGEANSYELIKLILKPILWPSLGAYIIIKLITRFKSTQRLKNRENTWDRDDSSRY